MASAYKPADGVSASFSIGEGYVLISAFFFGNTFGYYKDTAGSITPTILNGETIYAIITDTSPNTVVAIEAIVAQNFFNSITIDGLLLTTASADYSTNPGVPWTLWQWPGQSLIGSIGTYPVIFT